MSMSIKVKICGLTSEAAVKAVITAQTDYVGFVYFPASPRHLTLEKAAELAALLPDSILSVSVLVNPDDALLKEVTSIVKPHVLQLHGQESPERVQEIKNKFPGVKIIKAIAVSSSDDVAKANQYEDVVDMLMFDAKSPPSTGEEYLPGGNGLSFDWILLKHRAFTKPWFLSGGLTADNVQEAIHASGATMVDISSGVESAPGVKDAELIFEFIKAARK